jgi:hypothetical protein
LVDLLAERGDLDGLRALADADDRYAAWRLAERGDLDGATQMLRARADGGDHVAVSRLADLLAQHGDVDGATQVLRARADAGDFPAADQLARLLAERSDLDGTIQVLRAWSTPATTRPPHGWPICWPSRTAVRKRYGCSGSA